MYKNALSAGCINGINGLTIGSAACSEAGVSYSNTNSDLSADSGYHSRLCVDLNHDLDSENCSCSFYETHNIRPLSYRKSTVSTSSNGSNSISISNTSSQNSSTTIPKSHFETILKSILNDYVRVKAENENLRKELEIKNKSISLLKSTMDECKVKFDL